MDCKKGVVKEAGINENVSVGNFAEAIRPKQYHHTGWYIYANKSIDPLPDSKLSSAAASSIIFAETS